MFLNGFSNRFTHAGRSPYVNAPRAAPFPHTVGKCTTRPGRPAGGRQSLPVSSSVAAPSLRNGIAVLARQGLSTQVAKLPKVNVVRGTFSCHNHESQPSRYPSPLPLSLPCAHRGKPPCFLDNFRTTTSNFQRVLGRVWHFPRCTVRSGTIRIPFPLNLA